VTGFVPLVLEVETATHRAGDSPESFATRSADAYDFRPIREAHVGWKKCVARCLRRAVVRASCLSTTMDREFSQPLFS